MISEPDAPTFRDWYAKAAQQVREEPEASDGPTITISVQEMPLVDFARYLADQTGVSIVVASGIDARPVTLEVTEIPVEAVIALVARRLGVEANQSGACSSWESCGRRTGRSMCAT